MRRLIAFSNQSFYGGKLLTFPSSWLEHPEMGVKFVYLSSAVYGRGGSRANPDEANRVIEILEEELTSNPDHEVGVTAMSVAQATEIQARLEDAALSSPVIRSWLEGGGRARNLETVQGDEFDVSVLSQAAQERARPRIRYSGHRIRAFGLERLRVPWLSTGQTRLKGRYSHIDTVPTLLDLVGATTQDHLQGESRLPVLRGDSTLEGNDVVIDWTGLDVEPEAFPELERVQDTPHRTLVSADGWKLTLGQGMRGELYDMNSDPYEETNLFDWPDHEARIEDMAERLKRRQSQTGDTIELSTSR
jgi:hypothetical protein